MDLGKKIERVQIIDRSWVKPHLRARLEEAEKARQPMNFTPPPGYLEWDPKVPDAENARLGAKGMPPNRFNLYPGDVVRVVYEDYDGDLGELQIFQEINSAGRAVCLTPNNENKRWNRTDSIQLVARKGEWIGWEAGKGTECPVAQHIVVQVRLGCNDEVTSTAGRLLWDAHSSEGSDDIVVFRLV